MMAWGFLSLEFRLGSHDADRAISFSLITEDVWLCLFWKQLCLMMINDIQSEEMVFGAIQEKSVAYLFY